MKKLGLMCLALMLVLGTLGIGFAYWNDTLTIGPNPVNTGELNMGWGNPGPTVTEYGVYTGSVAVDEQTLTITVGNMYPSWGDSLDALTIWGSRIYNTGTIPVKFTGVDITWDPAYEELMKYMVVNFSVWRYNAAGSVSPSGCFLNTGEGQGQKGRLLNEPNPAKQNLAAVINNSVWVTDPVISVLGVGESYKFCGPEGEHTIRIHLHQDAPQTLEGTSGTFTIKFKFQQWKLP